MNHMIILAFVCLSFLANAALTMPPDLNECIAGIKRFEKNSERMSATYEIQRFRLKTIDDSAGTIPADKRFQESKIDYWRDGGKVRTLQMEKHRSPKGDQIAEFIQSHESLATPEIRVLVGRNPETGLFEDTNIIAQFASPDREPSRHVMSGIDLFILDSRLDFLGPKLSDRLNVANVTTTEDRLNDQRTARLRFEDAWGMHEVWLDPIRGYHPVRLIQQKEPRHWVRPNVRMEQLPENPRLGRMQSIKLEIIVSELKKVNGHWFATQFEERRQFVNNEAKEAEDKVSFRVSDISLDPLSRGNQFQITTAIPEGTWVVVNRQLNPRYEWRGGKVVRVGDR